MFYAERLAARTRGNGVGVFEGETFGKERIFIIEDCAGQEKQAFFVNENREILQVHPMVVRGGWAGPRFEIVAETRTTARGDFDPKGAVLGRTGSQERPCPRRRLGGNIEERPGFGWLVKRRRIFHSHRNSLRWGFGWRTRRRKNLLCSRSRIPPAVPRRWDPPTV